MGTMLAGPTAHIGGKDLLVSPAKVRVSRYMKGHGPKVVRVLTGIQSANTVNAEGIAPRVGQRWLIYSSSNAAPYATSICAGSSLLK
jgi:hypothetical protein